MLYTINKLAVTRWVFFPSFYRILVLPPNKLVLKKTKSLHLQVKYVITLFDYRTLFP